MASSRAINVETGALSHKLGWVDRGWTDAEKRGGGGGASEDRLGAEQRKSLQQVPATPLGFINPKGKHLARIYSEETKSNPEYETFCKTTALGFKNQQDSQGGHCQVGDWRERRQVPAPHVGV